LGGVASSLWPFAAAWREPVVLVELGVAEQRYRAVLEVLDGASVTEVARRYGVARQAPGFGIGGCDGVLVVAGVLATVDPLGGLAVGQHRPRPIARRVQVINNCRI